jgi:hypothetical protein
VDGKFSRCNNFVARKIEAAAIAAGGNLRHTVVL